MLSEKALRLNVDAVVKAANEHRKVEQELPAVPGYYTAEDFVLRVRFSGTDRVNYEVSIGDFEVDGSDPELAVAMLLTKISDATVSLASTNERIQKRVRFLDSLRGRR